VIPRPEIIAILKNSPNSASRFKSVEPSFSSGERDILTLRLRQGDLRAENVAMCLAAIRALVFPEGSDMVSGKSALGAMSTTLQSKFGQTMTDIMWLTLLLQKLDELSGIFTQFAFPIDTKDGKSMLEDAKKIAQRMHITGPATTATTSDIFTSAMGEARTCLAEEGFVGEYLQYTNGQLSSTQIISQFIMELRDTCEGYSTTFCRLAFGYEPERVFPGQMKMAPRKPHFIQQKMKLKDSLSATSTFKLVRLWPLLWPYRAVSWPASWVEDLVLSNQARPPNPTPGPCSWLASLGMGMKNI